MRTSPEAARNGKSPAEVIGTANGPDDFRSRIETWLDDAKAEDIVTIDLRGKTSIGDYMIVATGRSDRHVGAIADRIVRNLKEHGQGRTRVEGMQSCDWVLIDTGDIIVHVFRPEVREFYNLEKMWSGERPSDAMAS